MAEAMVIIMEKNNHIHFIGIGGISMSTLAVIAKTKGYVVTGSDRAPSALTERLARESDIPVYYPQKAENLGDAGTVVYTAAIAEDNPELAQARKSGLQLLTRSAYLGRIMSEYPVRIGVSGTHGKSSTTGMLSEIFMAADCDPTVACGAELPSLGGAYRLGKGRHFIYEACEYKDSFLDFCPSVAVMLNMEMDHVDYYHSMEQMEHSYTLSAKDAGAVVANWDDLHVRNALSKLQGVWTVKVSLEDQTADYTAANITTERGCASFDVMNEARRLCRVTLRIPGLYQVRNALCAAAAAHICGIEGEEISRGLNRYTGVRRRFEYKGQFGGAEIYDDYAHHPTEIRATLQTARQIVEKRGRLICVFQPHTYSRTAGLFEDFVKALSLADMLFLAPIYAAREVNTYGISSENLAERIEGARCLETFEEIASAVTKELREGDMLLTMGAGNAYLVGELLLGG